MKEAIIESNDSIFNSPQLIAQLFSFLEKKAEERVYVLALDAKCHPLGISEISHGTATLSLAGKKELFTRLLLMGATGFVLVHNHPSGCPEPSKEDNSLTGAVKDMAKLMEMTMHDHIIIGKRTYFSFRQNDSL